MADLQEESLAPGEVGKLDEPTAPVHGGDAVPPEYDEPAVPQDDPAPTEADGDTTRACDLSRARDLLARHPVADGHSGLPWALHQLSWYDLELGESALRTDIPRLREGAVGAQFWSLALPAEVRGERAVSATLDLIDLAGRVIASHPEALRLTRTPSDAADARSHGRIACLLGPAEARALGDSLGALRALHALGVRSLALHSTSWAAGAGLTRFGEEVVRECNRLGVLLDLSGSSPRTVERTLAVTKAPVVFSRSGAAALTPHPANVDDGVLAALRANKGLCMVPCAAERTGPTLARVADHLDHVRAVAGVECVALSGTYDTEDRPAQGVEDTSRYPELVAELLRRGWTETDLAQLTWGNVQRVLRDTEFTARAAQERRPPSTATAERLDG
ncbi:dipeptidase [Streptomyces indicus]|uniref:Zn-dependent dipeptidase, dipeptidase homolog n=1 Tax=Streptomyces indicus TaxID=417292 RepID=A0A1G9I2T7_9ACTN|nr:dipeptidase [Streptomyces indicus]SDL19392.1 Zn-dependent dipeptidase, dipeptidase homolog [Streptomyces indicus]